jgi:hypothetical protein
MCYCVGCNNTRENIKVEVIKSVMLIMEMLGKTNKKRLKETSDKLEEEDIESPLEQPNKLNKNHLVNKIYF